MTDLITFLTSEEIIVVYVIAGIACLLCLLVYVAEKTYYRRKRKMNTKELNQLVEQVQEQMEQNLDEQNLVIEVSTMEEKAEDIPKLEQQAFMIPEPVSEIKPVAIIPEIKKEPVEESNNSEMDNMVLEVIDSTVSKETPSKEEIQYENTEPDQTVAQAELERLTEELKKAEETVQNIELTEFEAEQEENAIISLEELLAKGDSLYEKNELTQYEDEGNEPISIQDLEKKMKKMQESSVIMEEEKQEAILKETEKTSTTMYLDDFNTVKVETPSKAYQGTHAFKSSPVISPIYGIEEQKTLPKQTELELENTANYEKLDEEIRKTNEFIMTLKELQKNLD